MERVGVWGGGSHIMDKWEEVKKNKSKKGGTDVK